MIGLRTHRKLKTISHRFTEADSALFSKPSGLFPFRFYKEHPDETLIVALSTYSACWMMQNCIMNQSMMRSSGMLSGFMSSGWQEKQE